MIKSGLYQPAFYLLKNPYGFFNNSLQPAARINCLLKADNFHTCSLTGIFCQVHAPAENVLHFIFCFRRKLCEALFTGGV